MPWRYRVIWVTVFVLIFLLLSTVILAGTFGYRYDLETGEVSYTASVEVVTEPGGADVTVGPEYVESVASTRSPRGLSGGEFVYSDGATTDIKISLNGYQDEYLKLSSPKSQNSFTRIEELSLVPNKPRVVDTSDLVDHDVESFISDIYMVISGKQSEEKFIQQYSTSGLQGEKIEIEGDFRNSEKWNKISRDVFVSRDQEGLLYQSEDVWKYEDLRSLFNVGVASVIHHGDGLYILTDDTKVWGYDYLTEEGAVEFLESGVSGLHKASKSPGIYILKNGSIIKFNDSFESYFDNKTELIASELVVGSVLDSEEFIVDDFYQGKVIRVGDKLWYLGRSSGGLKFIASEVLHQDYESKSGVVSWVENDGSIKILGLINEVRTTIGTIENIADIVALDYNSWSRVNLYSEDSVQSVWYNQIEDSSLVKTRSLNSIASNCLWEIKNNEQFCIEDGELVYYVKSLL